MIKISGRADSVFEEAYFIMKPQSFKHIMSERDLVLEANKIIKETSLKQEKSARRAIRISPVFFLSLLITSLGGLVSTVVLIFF